MTIIHYVLFFVNLHQMHVSCYAMGVIQWRWISCPCVSQICQLLALYRQVGDECPNYLEQKDRGLLLALDGEQLVGLACISHRPWSRVASIDQIFVCPDYRRWGIATHLVGLAITYAREQEMRTLLAESPVTNPALLVYLKAGFRVSGFTDTHISPDGEGPTTALFLSYDLG